MSVYLLKELDRIKTKLLTLGAATEDCVHRAVAAVIERDASLAAGISGFDKSIDKNEVQLEEEILKILALHQPVAIDLRFLIAVLKITSDLERIGDLALNISRRAEFIAGLPHVALPVDLAVMSATVEGMLRDSIESFIQLSSEKAAAICKRDDEVDKMKAQYTDVIKQQLVQAADQTVVDVLVAALAITRDLERIADHATNIAEDVVYFVEGFIIRHHAAEYSPAQK